MDRTKVIAGLIAVMLVGCGRPARIVVGSKNFTEQVLLGEILAQQIERRLGVAVERKLDLGGTLLAHEALAGGSIDLYPEYTGTALTTILKQPPAANPGAALEQVRRQYRSRWHLEWLDPLGFNDSFAMIVGRDTARSAGLSALSQAAASRAWRLGVGYEFEQRPDGLSGLVKAYGLRLQGTPVTMDLGLLYAALASGKVDMIAANSTDGLASVLPVTILQDDRHYFPSYECAVVVREDTIRKYPQLKGILQELSGRIPDGVMRRLNYEVDGMHRPVAEVARSFLR